LRYLPPYSPDMNPIEKAYSKLKSARLIVQYNTTVEMLTQHILRLNADQWVAAIQQIYEHLDLLDRVVDKADHEVRPIHDRVLG
jgi:hypothetical protein